MTFIDQIEGWIGPGIAGMVGYLGALFIRRSSKESNNTESWRALFDGHQQWTKDQLAEQDTWTKERLAERDAKIEALEVHVSELSESFDFLRIKYRAALVHIGIVRPILSTFVPHGEMPIVPSEIAADL